MGIHKVEHPKSVYKFAASDQRLRANSGARPDGRVKVLTLDAAIVYGRRTTARHPEDGDQHVDAMGRGP
jgi:hypothetical protein